MSVNMKGFAPHTMLCCPSHFGLCTIRVGLDLKDPQDHHKMEHFPEMFHFPSLAVFPDISSTESTAN